MSDSKIRNMEEFAAKSGVSRPTVSKYFNDPNSVRETTRKRIEDALGKYDFRPNAYAINQNRRLTKNIGIVVPYVADPFFAEVARMLELRCIDAGYSPTTFSAHGLPHLEVSILETLRSMRPAGVLLAPLGRASDRAALESLCSEMPTVLIDSNLDGVGEAFIGSDNMQSMSMMVDYLCRSGSAPCFFEMPPVNPNANRRRAAYTASMETLGHRPDIIRVEGDGWDFEEIGYSQGKIVLQQGRLTSDTVLCSNDRLAIGLLAAAYECGIKVGIGPDKDLRIAGHDDHPFARFTCPSLTTAAQNYEAITATGVNTLLDLIEAGGKFDDRPQTVFEKRLILRASA